MRPDRSQSEPVRRLAALAALVAGLAIGCTTPTTGREEEPSIFAIPPRTYSLIVEGCSLDEWQTRTLQSANARRVVSTVVLLCASLRTDGHVSPVDAAARSGLGQTIALLRGWGYAVHLGVNVGDSWWSAYPEVDTVRLLGSTTPEMIEELVAVGAGAGGFEIALSDWAVAPDINQPQDLVRPSQIARLITQLRARVGTAPRVVAWIDPVEVLPELVSLAPHVDAARVMTLDYSCCGEPPGPTIEPGWAVDVMRKVSSSSLAKDVPLDISFPLYGYDFQPKQGRPITYFEAKGIAAYYGIELQRTVNGTPHFAFMDHTGDSHELWFDDARSTAQVLSAWTHATLPANVGVTLYGLGAEDPAVWPTLARSKP